MCVCVFMRANISLLTLKCRAALSFSLFLSPCVWDGRLGADVTDKLGDTDIKPADEAGVVGSQPSECSPCHVPFSRFLLIFSWASRCIFGAVNRAERLKKQYTVSVQEKDEHSVLVIIVRAPTRDRESD